MPDHTQEATRLSRTAQEYQAMRDRAASAGGNGDAVQRVVGDRAREIAMDADRSRMAHAGEHLANMYDDVIRMNQRLPAHLRMTGDGTESFRVTREETLINIRATRNSYGHPEQNIGRYEASNYQQASQQAMREMQQKELAFKRIINNHEAGTDGKPLVDDVAREAAKKGLARLQLAQEEIKPLTKGLSKGSQLTVEQMDRAIEFKKFEAGSHAYHSPNKLALGNLTSERDKIIHDNNAARAQARVTANEEIFARTHAPHGARGAAAAGVAGMVVAGVVAATDARAGGANATQTAGAAVEGIVPGASAFNLAMQGRYGDAFVSAAGAAGCAIGAVPGAALGAAGGALVGSVAGPVGTGAGTAAGLTGGGAYGCGVGYDALTTVAQSLRNYVTGGTTAHSAPVQQTPAVTVAAAEQINPQMRR